MVYGLAAFCRVGSKVFMPLLGCEGVSSLQVKSSLSWVAWSGTDMNVCWQTNGG